MNKIRKILLYSLIIWSIFLYSNIKVNAEELINNTDNKEKEETNTLIGDINKVPRLWLELIEPFLFIPITLLFCKFNIVAPYEPLS